MRTSPPKKGSQPHRRQKTRWASNTRVRITRWHVRENRIGGRQDTLKGRCPVRPQRCPKVIHHPRNARKGGRTAQHNSTHITRDSHHRCVGGKKENEDQKEKPHGPKKSTDDQIRIRRRHNYGQGQAARREEGGGRGAGRAGAVGGRAGRQGAGVRRRVSVGSGQAARGQGHRAGWLPRWRAGAHVVDSARAGRSRSRRGGMPGRVAVPR